MPASPQKKAEIADFELRVARLYAIDKMSTAAIAERMGCWRGWVRLALVRAGVPRRKRGIANG